MNVRQTNIGHSATQGNVINAYQTSQRSNELGVSGQLSFNQQVIDQQMQLHSQNKVYTMGMRNSSTLNSQEVVGQQVNEMPQDPIAIEENMYARNIERADMEDADGIDQR